MAKSHNTTIQNRAKAERLATAHVVPRHRINSASALRYISTLDPADYRQPEILHAFLYSVGRSLFSTPLPDHVEAALGPFRTDLVPVGDVPRDCFDLLGSIYQYLNTKQENLAKGSFYTGPLMALDFVSDLDFSEGQTILDPACGTGVFLLQSDAPPGQLFGLDSDPLAVMIARFNYFLKYPDGPPPNLHCADFFEWLVNNRHKRFDYLIANPPYGANVNLPAELHTQISSGESFSYFIELGMSLVRENGTARHLVPDALLNVKRHEEIREILLDKLDLRRIKRYARRFSGLMSDVYQIEVGHGKSTSIVMEASDTTTRTPEFIKSFKNSIFSFLTDREVYLIELARARCTRSLSGCQFGLGVVTGNNKKFLHDTPLPGSEPIYSGKEVQPYQLSAPQKYIAFHRERLQQVAPDAIYRAPVKLVYKTISRTLKVAIDRTGSLTTNSANIIIPDPSLMSPEALAAILNSSLASFLYVKLFGNVNKIGQAHLVALPIPEVSPEYDRWLCKQASQPPDPATQECIDEFVALQLYGVSKDDLEFVRAALA